MSNKTQNYKLNLFDRGEKPDNELFNENNRIIDNALYEAYTHTHDGINSAKIKATDVKFSNYDTSLTATNIEDAVKEVLVKEAERLKAQLYQPKKDAIRNLLYDMNGMQFDYVREDNSQWKIGLPLTGAYQAANAACALKVIEVLKEKTFPQLTLSVIQNGFQKVCWNGRFERVLEEPLCILDGAHNEGAALQLAKTLENCFTNRKITYIIGVLADKAHEKILKIMRPYSETVYAVTPHNGRALPAEKLSEEAKAAGYQTVITEPLIEDAVRHAIAESSGEDVVLIFGSLSYLAEAKQAVIQYREGQKNDR